MGSSLFSVTTDHCDSYQIFYLVAKAIAGENRALTDSQTSHSGQNQPKRVDRAQINKEDNTLTEPKYML